MLQDAFGLLGMHDQPHCHGLDVRFALELVGVRHLVAVADRRARQRTGQHTAAGAVDHVDTLGLQDAGQRDAALRVPARAIVDRQAHEQRLVSGPVGARALGHLDREAHAVLEAAAVLVGALVGMGVEKLVDQEAVRTMQLDDVEASGMRARGGLAPVFGQLPDLVAFQCARHRRSGVGGDRAGGDQFPVIPVVDVGAALQRLAAFPGPGDARLATRVAQLDADGRTTGLGELGDAPQRRHEGIVPEAQVAHRAAAPAFDLGRLDEEQPCAARGVAPGVHQVPIGREALDRRILVHGCHDDTVLQ